MHRSRLHFSFMAALDVSIWTLEKPFKLYTRQKNSLHIRHVDPHLRVRVRACRWRTEGDFHLTDNSGAFTL